MKSEQKQQKKVIETIDESIGILDRKLEESTPLHIRDKRAEPDDGYGNYMTMAEAIVLGIMNADINDQRSALIAAKNNLKENL